MLHQVRKTYAKTLYTMNIHLNMHLDILKKRTDISNLIHMSQSTVLTCLHISIYIYIYTFNIYSLCNKKGKVLFVIQYNFNVAVSSPLESVNANHTLLPSSPSPTVKVTESRTDTNLKPTMEAGCTSVKEKLWKNFLYNAYM